MILGIGSDIVNIKRIEKILQESEKKFLEKYFTKEEIKISKSYKGRKYAAYFAKRFAAKEAVAKALGTGFGKNLSFNEISIIKEKSGKPGLELSGKAFKLAEKIAAGKGIPAFSLSLSDEYPSAIAMVVFSVE